MKPVPEELQTELWDFWRRQVGGLADIEALDIKMSKEGWTKSRGWNGYQDFLIRETEQIWSSLQPVLHVSEKNKLKGVLFAILPAYDFNGIACLLPSGQTIIGISAFLAVLSVVDLRIWKAQGHYEQLLPLLRNGLQNDSRAARAAEPLVHELNEIRHIARVVTGITSNLKELESSTEVELKEHASFVNGVYGIQQYFIILHEIAHICLGHLDQSKMIRLSDESSRFSMLLSQPSHEMEHQADLFALTRNPYDLGHLDYPLGILFAFLRFVEEAYSYFSNPKNPYEAVHKPSELDHSLSTHPFPPKADLKGCIMMAD